MQDSSEIDKETFTAVIQNVMKISSNEELEQLATILEIDLGISKNALQQGDVVPSTEDERKKAERDQYADEVVGIQTMSNSTDITDANQFIDMAKFVPLRLEYNERRYLRLLESTIDSSEYTDRVDGIPISRSTTHQHRLTALILKNICSLLSGLLIAHDSSSKTVEAVLENREFTKYQNFYRKVFEIGRRYKILNPERMRESYFKMMYFLQDLERREVSELFDHFKVDSPVETVYSLLISKDPDNPEQALALLRDTWIETATSEIIPRGKTKYKVQEEIKAKESAIKRLTTKYATGPIRSSRSSRSRFSFFSGRDSDMEDDNVQSGQAGLTRDEVERCLYSLCDFNTFLRFNQVPCERIIELLEKYFTPSGSPESSLAIVDGEDGARLSHSHSRQYTFVIQSLTLWAEVMKDMLKLWHAAESDILDPSNPYVRTETGQGLQRVQKAPRVMALMTSILQRVQRRLGGWVGSSTIHLGDENVPNALIFIDKYMQVPKILQPIVLCIDKIEGESGYRSGTPGLAEVVESMGGVERLQRMILRDFFRHGFDGSGADNFFDAGSCVDGRLTSAWNWCSRIEQKEYYPVFQLTGFVGFDSSGASR